MKKIVLSKFDLNRLSEMIEKYLNPQKSFMIYGDGDISLQKDPYIFRLMNIKGRNTIDFLNATQLIITEILKKNDNDETQYLCNEAIELIVNKNDRAKAIECLYKATLEEKEEDENVRTKISNPNGNKMPRGIEIDSIEVRHSMVPERNVISVFKKEGNLYNRADEIANAMNGMSNVIVIGKN